MTPGTARLALLLCAWCAACAAPPPPQPAPPGVTSSLRHLSGTALSGRRPRPEAAAELADGASLAVRCTLRFAPLAPAEFPFGEVLAPRISTIVARRAGSPFGGASRLTAAARLGEGEPMIATGETPLAELDAALPRGVTLEFALHERGAAASPADDDPPIAVLVSRTPAEGEDRVSVAFALRGLDPGSQTGLHELVAVAPELPVDRAPIWFALPSPFGATLGSIVVRIEARTPPPGDVAHRAALAACLDDLHTQGQLEQSALQALGDDDALARALATAAASFTTAPELRRAVAFVAARAGSLVLLDLALAGDDDTLRTLAERIAAAGGGAGATAIAWTLDALAWRLLAERLDAGTLDDARRGFLLRHAGELGRFPGGLTALLERSASASDFEAALIAENRTFLATSDPASRVRAHDWLAARGHALADYDPLAPREERQAALERFEDARAGERR